MSQSASEPRFIEFGPYRVIGVGRVAKGSPDCVAAWDDGSGFIARMGEVEPSEGADFLVGMVRCIPGVTDGSFQYIAARPAKPDAAIPSGMIEALIAAGTYAVFPINGLAELGPGWGRAIAWLEAHPEWLTYCNKDGCDCANHTSFEFYPPSFGEDGKMFIYFPVRKAKT